MLAPGTIGFEVSSGGAGDGAPDRVAHEVVMRKCLFCALPSEAQSTLAVLVDEQPGDHPYLEGIDIHDWSTRASRGLVHTARARSGARLGHAAASTPRPVVTVILL